MSSSRVETAAQSPLLSSSLSFSPWSCVCVKGWSATRWTGLHDPLLATWTGLHDPLLNAAAWTGLHDPLLAAGRSAPEPWLLPGCSSVYDSLVSNVSPVLSPPLNAQRGRERASGSKVRRPSILERCILKVSTSSVAVGTDDVDKRSRCSPRLLDPTNTETNEAVLKRRQKQIHYGKITNGYQNYLQQVPKAHRDPKLHPSTPNMYRKYSRRSWDMQVRMWRRGLHLWDPPTNTQPDHAYDPVEQLQSQLAQMSSAEDRGDKQREEEPPAAPHASSESPGLWTTPFCPEAETSHRPLRPPPGLSSSLRSQLTSKDNMADWLRLLLEADPAPDPGSDDQQVPVFSDQLSWNPY